MFENDFVMRMIHEMVRTLLKLIFNLDEPEEGEELVFADAQTSGKYEALSQLIADGKICEAEDMLYEHLDPLNREEFKMALYFYDELNALDNDTLEQAGFSREEVKDGLRTVTKMFGYEGLANPLLAD